jgi:hypothetical protein
MVPIQIHHSKIFLILNGADTQHSYNIGSPTIHLRKMLTNVFPNSDPAKHINEAIRILNEGCGWHDNLLLQKEQKRLNDIVEQKRLNDIAEQKRLNDIIEQKRLNDIIEQKRLDAIIEQKRLDELRSDIRQKKEEYEKLIKERINSNPLFGGFNYKFTT